MYWPGLNSRTVWQFQTPSLQIGFAQFRKASNANGAIQSGAYNL